MKKIKIIPEDDSLLSQAKILAQEFHFSLMSEDYDYLLLLNHNFVGLAKKGQEKPFYFDFLEKKIDFRRKQANMRREKLVRAMGLTQNTPATIVDATAGLGRDSFILASLGFEVNLIERNPIVYVLLRDALMRAAKELPKIVNQLHLFHSDAKIWLKKSNKKADIIYLDPMFPEKKKTALAKKEMQIFQDLIDEEDDCAELLRIALSCAQKRVVVKRPRLGPSISGPAPSYSLVGKSSRFDIYLTQETHGNRT